MSVRAFPIIKDESYKEAYFYAKNVEAAQDADCPEIVKACKAIEIANDLAEAGWKVKVAPFEDYPMLHVRAKKKAKTK